LGKLKSSWPPANITPRALLANIRTRRVEFGELNDLLGVENLFLNLNTADDLRQGQKLNI